MIRPAGEGDLSRVAEILVFGKRTAYRNYFQDDAGSFNGLQTLPVAREMEPLLGDVLVYDDGIVKGMLRRAYGAGEAEICELYVEPFFTGEGVGGALLDAFLAEAREKGARRVSLWVICENGGARRFYASRGFRPAGEERPIGESGVWECRYTLSLRGSAGA